MVVDGAKLLIFRNEGDEKYAVLETLSHEEEASLPSREHGTDTPGRTRSSVGGRRSSYGETDWHRQSEEEFAHHAARVLEKTAGTHPEAGIVVIAAPRTLGELRRHYGRETGRRLLSEIAKDLTGQMTDDVVDVIAKHRAQ